MFIDLHIIQNFAPSNLNRDDTGNPKDCEFGGVRRARISSQCIKRAIRKTPVFMQTTGVDLGLRTKRMVEFIKKDIVAAGKEPEAAEKIISQIVETYYSKLDKNEKPKTAVLLYISAAEKEEMVKSVLDRWGELSVADNKTIVDKLAKDWSKINQGTTSAPDIALFGRMLAEHPDLNLDAACQVAHALSTHRVTMEMDYYTAVDDLNPKDTAGAGMIGFVGFNSACFYRYACIDWEQLVHNLRGDVVLARRTVEAFLRASVDAIPTGKQTSFAANNLPGFNFAVVHEDGTPWSLANAFEQAVRADREGGYFKPSVKALDAYWGRLAKVYGLEKRSHLAALCLDEQPPLQNLAPALKEDLESWIKAVMDALPKE